LNKHLIEREQTFEAILNDTVPHEMAHIICFLHPRLGKNHDIGWRKVCKELGGTGNTCHKHLVKYARGKTYQYTTTLGIDMNVSQVRHRRIQSGIIYDYGKHGTLNKDCSCTVI
jgi:predicted SprT family Zn-dependent metalloprotease